MHGPPDFESLLARMPDAERRERARAAYRRNMALLPVNVRVLDGVDIKALKVERRDEGTKGYVLD
jgi:hypothetical protein